MKLPDDPFKGVNPFRGTAMRPNSDSVIGSMVECQPGQVIVVGNYRMVVLHPLTEEEFYKALDDERVTRSGNLNSKTGEFVSGKPQMKSKYFYRIRLEMAKGRDIPTGGL